MAIDYGEKEREFLDSLTADTGRDLATWMSAIAAAGLSERNEIIDWLRHQGFMFSKASWLERIFNNGGKPIYAERGPLKGTRTRAPARPRAPSHEPPREEHPLPPPSIAPAPAPSLPPSLPPLAAVPMQRRPEPPPSSPGPAPEPVREAPQQDLDATLAKAKAFRPLASFVLAEIAKALPGVTLAAYGTHVALMLEGTEVAILAVSGKDIRLFLQGLGMPFDAGFGPAKLPAGLTGVRLTPTHMVVLTDARAVTPALIERVRAAAIKTRD